MVFRPFPNRASRGLFRGMNPTTSLASMAALVLILIPGIFYTDGLGTMLAAGRQLISPMLEWYYVALVAFFTALMIWLGLGRYGNVRLGPDDSRPEFGLFPWIAMLFAAGTGIGLLFWSIAEPISHLDGNPFIDSARSPEGATVALRLTFFHWGLNGWAIFAVVGLVLAYFGYRLNQPLTMRAALFPLIGRRIDGPVGHAVDTFSVLATVFGIATTLGLGVEQINRGLNRVFGLAISETNQLLIIGVVTLIATFSVMSGLRRGVRRLSVFNIWVSVVLLAFFLAVGPTNYQMNILVQTTGSYLQHLVEMTFYTNANGMHAWQNEWTVFFWGWWIAWSPFVGMFIARISRGRTIREYAFGVLLVPSVFTFIWIASFGGTAIHLELFGPGGITQAVQADVSTALFHTIEEMTDSRVLVNLASVTAILLIAVYFITSADSGTLVINTILSNGDPDPPRAHRLAWGLGIGVLTAILMLAGGVTTLQDAVVMAGFPFSIIILLMIGGLIRELKRERFAGRMPEKQRLAEEPWTGYDRPL